MFRQISLTVMILLGITIAGSSSNTTKAATDNNETSNSIMSMQSSAKESSAEKFFASEATVTMYIDENGKSHSFTIECTLPLKQSELYPLGIYHYYVYTDAHGTTFDGRTYIP